MKASLLIYYVQVEMNGLRAERLAEYILTSPDCISSRDLPNIIESKLLTYYPLPDANSPEMKQVHAILDGGQCASADQEATPKPKHAALFEIMANNAYAKFASEDEKLPVCIFSIIGMFLHSINHSTLSRVRTHRVERCSTYKRGCATA